MTPSNPPGLTSDSIPLSEVRPRTAPHGNLPAIRAASDLVSLVDRARDYAADARAENTRRAYRSDWRDFSEFCRRHGATALPATAETLAAYLVDRAETHKASTLFRRLSAISQAHQLAGHPSPTHAPAVRLVWAGIRRRKGTAREGKAAAVAADMRRLVAACGEDLAGVRDRAILLLGFGGAFRRSEIVALNVADVRMTRDGAAVTIRRSKTDQEGEGAVVGVPYGSRPQVCPVRALKAWLMAAGILEGAIFRAVDRHGNLSIARLSGRAVWEIVKRRAALACLDPTLYGAHSLRSGHATSAAAGGAEERAIMRQGRWRDLKTARGYIREGTLWRDNSGHSLGL